MVSPSGFFSALSPPLLPGYPGLSKTLRFLGPAFWGPLGHSLKRATRFWARPWYQLRRELGLPSTAEPNPLVDGQSPLLQLALFSRWLADKQPDWPAQTAITGSRFMTGDGAGGLPPDLARFLNEGSPPWSSPSDRRQPRSPDRSMSRAPPPDNWAAERSSFWETPAPGPPLCLKGLLHLSTPRLRRSSSGPECWSIPVASAPPDWRCAPGCPCWSCPSPTISRTMPTV